MNRVMKGETMDANCLSKELAGVFVEAFLNQAAVIGRLEPVVIGFGNSVKKPAIFKFKLAICRGTG